MLKDFMQAHVFEAGCDEVGRGCLAGPVVAAAVILNADKPIKGLNDSKKLSLRQRNELAIEIKEKSLCYSIQEVDAARIDEINILNASIEAMHLALKELNPVPEHILVDGNRFKPFNAIPYTCVVKGDGIFASIAAASILAKTYRDHLMEQLHQQFPFYAWDSNMGYPTVKHRKGIMQHGPCALHRKTFQLLAADEQLKFKF